MPNVSRRMTVLLATTSVLVLSGCAIPNLGVRPRLADAAGYASTHSLEPGSAAWPADRWWEAYGDSQLNTLIAEALADAPTLAAAAARVRRAESAVQQTDAALSPTIGAQSAFSATRADVNADNRSPALAEALPSGWINRASVSAKLEYQLDFFGRNRAAVAAATSRAHAAAMEASAARLHLSTAVASAYAELLRLSADHAAALEVERLKASTLDLVRQRRVRGLENDAQVSQAESEHARAEADAAALSGAIARARNQIAALLGKGPDRGLDIIVPETPIGALHGLPRDAALDLVGRRPDLAAARARAEAAAGGIDVARADYYPNISLSALAGLQTLGLDRIGGSEVSFGQAGPAVSLPIFSGGRLEGAYRAARADYDEAVALYNETLTTAIREVADAVSDRRALETQIGHARRSLAAGETAYRSMRLRYENGLASYIDVLAVENGLVVQRRVVASLENQAFAIDITLVRALGGGFTAA